METKPDNKLALSIMGADLPPSEWAKRFGVTVEEVWAMSYELRMPLGLEREQLHLLSAKPSTSKGKPKAGK